MRFHHLDGLEPEDRGMVYAKVRQYLNAIAEPAAATCGYSSASAESSSGPPAKKPALDRKPTAMELVCWQQAKQQFTTGKQPEEKGVEQELELYLQEEQADISTSLLAWWKMNEKKYPWIS